MPIDLRGYRDPVAQFISESLSRYVSQHPNVCICTIGLFGDGFHGSASLHLDTPDHCQSFVEEWQKKGPDWYGEDAQGRFCNSCWDFPCCIGELTSFPDYPDFYEGDDDVPIDFITLDGETTRIEAEAGDEGLHEVMFPFLKTILQTCQPFSKLKRVAPFRAGVQMRDSICVDFWHVDVR